MNQLPHKDQDALKNLFNDSMLEQPSDIFTASVMNRLNLAPAATAIKYEPVITRNGWIFISVLTGLIFYLAISGTVTDSFSSKSMMLESILDQGAAAAGSMLSGSVALLLALVTLAAFVLIGVESWYRQSRLRTT